MRNPKRGGKGDSCTFGKTVCPVLHKGMLAAVTALFITIIPTTAAASACPPLPNIQEGASHDEWQFSRDYLSLQLDHCLENPYFFAQYGAALLRTGQVEKSVEMLERALLLDPDNGAALIDYSEALYISGKLHAAIRLNSRLLARHDLPQPVRTVLEHRAESWKKLREQWSRRASLLVGYDDNLNIAADLEQLRLTIDNQQILVNLAENSRPVAGSYIHALLTLAHTETLDNATKRGYATLQTRSSELQETNIDQLNFGFQKQQRTLTGSYNWKFDNRLLVYGGNDYFITSEISAEKSWQKEACSPYIGASLKTLFVPSQNDNNDVALSLIPGARCSFDSGLYDIQLRLSQNQATKDRSGGNRSGAEIAMRWQKPIGSSHMLAFASYGILEDSEGYSPLLDNNAKRFNRNTNLSLQYIHPVSTNVTFHLGINYQKQQSNLELFSTRSRSIDAGFSVLF